MAQLLTASARHPAPPSLPGRALFGGLAQATIDSPFLDPTLGVIYAPSTNTVPVRALPWPGRLRSANPTFTLPPFFQACWLLRPSHPWPLNPPLQVTATCTVQGRYAQVRPALPHPCRLSVDTTRCRHWTARQQGVPLPGSQLFPRRDPSGSPTPSLHRRTRQTSPTAHRFLQKASWKVFQPRWASQWHCPSH